MNRRTCIIACFGILGACISPAQEDPGKSKVGQVTVTVYHATDGDPDVAGAKAKSVPREITDRLRKEKRLRFKNYRLIGQDSQALLRSYESWAQPLKPSDEVMVRFEAQGRPTAQSAILDLELWLGRKKTIKTDARLEGDRPLFVLGPEWRGGRLIIAVALAQEKKSGS
jgi:hypothetical protein